jgi:rfaE bifunctional protein nucleotidyltransferase chain/domain
MIIAKPWGYEDKICRSGRKLVFNEQFCTSIHKHSVEETILVDSGLLIVDSGPDPENFVSRIFVEDNARLTTAAETWHRFIALRDSVLIDFTNREDSDVIRHANGGRISDEEFRTYLTTVTKLHEQDRVMTAERAGAISMAIHSAGHTVGFCNGCFDLMHLGHVELLRQAKTRCDYLFVGVNTDASTKLLKGDSRPFVDEVGRFAMVESCRFVDYVVEAPDKTCVALISKIKPDVYITTSEYGTAGVEAKVVLSQGGKVDVIEMINGYNTTKLAMSVAGKRGK